MTSLVAMEMLGLGRGILTLMCLPFVLFASFQLISNGLFIRTQTLELEPTIDLSAGDGCDTHKVLTPVTAALWST